MADESVALDSRAVLGLLAYLQRIIVTGDAWLSFPLGTPLAFNAEQLESAMSPALDAPGHALLAEFSTIVNILPGGVIWHPGQVGKLDDIVRAILDEAEWAVDERTAAEEAEFAAASQQVDLQNPEMATYHSLKDSWIRAREFLANHPDSQEAAEAENSAHLALVVFPARERIEKAIEDLIALDERAPFSTRDRLEEEMGQGKGTFDDPIAGRFSPVRLLPRSILTGVVWDSVVLGGDQLQDLYATAPTELTEHLVFDDSAEETVAQIAFEYATSPLQRSWFDERIFKLGCWRFSDESRWLSDGQTPATGECTSYVRAVVLARNVSVSSWATVDAATATDSGTSNATSFLVPEVVDINPIPPELQAEWDAVDVEIAEDEAALDQVREMAEMLWQRINDEEDTFLIGELLSLPDREALDQVQQQRSQVEARLNVAYQSRAARVTVMADFGRALAASAVSPDALAAAARAPDVALAQPFDASPLQPPAPQDGLETNTTPDGAVIVVAMICLPVPRSPDPNPDFAWD